MADTFTPPLAPLKIEFTGTALDTRVQIRIETAAEKPALGQPGKQSGEVLLQQSGTGSTVLVVSLGAASKVRTESFRVAGGALATYLLKNKVTEAQLDLGQVDFSRVMDGFKSFCEGLLLGAFHFDRYKTGEDQKISCTLFITGSGQDAMQPVAARVEKVAAAVNLARDWAHEPANVINPVTLAARVTELAAQYNLKVTVVDDRALAEMGAGAILSVGKGSKTPSRLIVLEYPGSQPEPGAQPTVIIGKALTFDTGGYSIKSTEGILGMKYDKCGAMTVVGVMVAVATLGLKNPVVGILGAAENMISGESYRPDDILTTLSGKTVEIISTDAEGRLVLADTLTYAQKHFSPRAIIDLATLTGGVVVSLGRVRAGVMANDDELAAALLASGERTFERLWRLPLDEEYDQQIKGDDSDIKNSGGREAAPVIGGTFLKQFVDPEIPWAHIDIAGVATTPKDTPYLRKGATGFGVRLLVDYLTMHEIE